jgi:soluble cytochrome b562
MVQYTLAQSPEVIFTVPGKDSNKARDKAMAQLMERMENGQLPTELTDGFSPQEFIEVREPNLPPPPEEDAVIQAVQVLSNLATLKIKVQSSRQDALQIRAQIDKLFTDEVLTDEEMADLKKGFKVLQSFAQTNLRYREARNHAEEARTILDKALSS